MILTVTLNATIDVVMPLNFLEKGKVLRTIAIYLYPGGKGTNVARALSTLGSNVTATGFCGENDFKFMDDFLKKHGVLNKFIRVKGHNRPCILLTEEKNKIETIINSESSFIVPKKNIVRFLSLIENLSKISKYTIISGSIPLCLPENIYDIIINRIKHSTVVLLDTSKEYLKYGVKASPHILKLNIDELKNTFNVKIKTKNHLKNLISAIGDKYKIETVIVTFHKKGVLLFHNKKFYFFNALKFKNIASPVGSGDAFSAGFIYGLHNNKDIIYSTKLGIACASANLLHYGSCFFNKKEVYYFMNKIKYMSY